MDQGYYSAIPTSGGRKDLAHKFINHQKGNLRMTIDQLPLYQTASGAVSYILASSSDEMLHTNGSLARITGLINRLMVDFDFSQLHPTKQADFLIKLMHLEHRVLVQRDQSLKKAKKSGELPDSLALTPLSDALSETAMTDTISPVSDFSNIQRSDSSALQSSLSVSSDHRFLNTPTPLSTEGEAAVSPSSSPTLDEPDMETIADYQDTDLLPSPSSSVEDPSLEDSEDKGSVSIPDTFTESTNSEPLASTSGQEPGIAKNNENKKAQTKVFQHPSQASKKRLIHGKKKRKH